LFVGETTTGLIFDPYKPYCY